MTYIIEETAFSGSAKEKTDYPESIADTKRNAPKTLVYWQTSGSEHGRRWLSWEPEDLRLYGNAMAKVFAEHLAEAGVQIISGMAWGIDSHAHEGALEAGWRYLCRAGMWCGCLLSGRTEASL